MQTHILKLFENKFLFKIFEFLRRAVNIESTSRKSNDSHFHTQIPKQNTLQCSATQIHFTKIVLQDKFIDYKFGFKTLSKSIFLCA